MILLFHIFIGAVIATKISYLPFAVLFSFLSHYLLDFLPHNEYLLKNIEKKEWRKSGLDFLKLGIDFSIGLLLVLSVFYTTRTSFLLIIVCSFFSILPDLLLVWNRMFPEKGILLKETSNINQKVHFFKYKKTKAPNKLGAWPSTKNLIFSALVSSLGKLVTQLLVILIGLVILLKT